MNRNIDYGAVVLATRAVRSAARNIVGSLSEKQIMLLAEQHQSVENLSRELFKTRQLVNGTVERCLFAPREAATRTEEVEFTAILGNGK